MRSGSLCALLWRLLLWCNQRQIVLRARHIPGHLNVIADKLSRHKQVIQTVVSPSGGVHSFMPALARSGSGFICNPVQSQTSQVCVSGSRPVSLEGQCPESPVGRSERLRLPSDGHSASGGVQTVGPQLPSHHSDCSRMAKHAMVLGPGQHVSSNCPLPQVTNLLTQPFNQCPHRDLLNLNLHAWLLEPLPSSKQGSLQKWQQELRLLRDAQPEPFMSQSGTFLSDGVRKIRWTSDLPL